MTGVAIILWLALVAIGAWLTTGLALRVWKQGKGVGFGAEIMATLAVASATFCLFATIMGLQKIFGAIVAETVEPAQRARVLAEGISTVMNCTAFALALWIPSFIGAQVMLRRRGG